MNKIKVMTIFGTRPEAVKMAPLVKELEKCDEIDSLVCVTAQHRQMLDQVLELYSVKPDFDLDIMKESQSLSSITTSVLSGIENIFMKTRPDIVLVHGDTTTTFVGSLAAFYNRIKVGHVEAGLRTFNKYFPYPEEINRKLTGVLADLHFAPTRTARENLINEGVCEENIFVTGNTVIDAMSTTVDRGYTFKMPELNSIDFKRRKVILVTAHRRENWGEPLENICRALKRIAQSYEDVEIIYLVHLNPIVKQTAYSILSGIDRVHLYPPLDARETHNLMDRCYMVLTDSGGLQEEAPHLGKPVLVLREETERPEAVAAGTVKIAGTDENIIFREACSLMDNHDIYSKMANAVNPYGDGKASKRIIQSILYSFGRVKERPSDYSPKK